MTIRIVQKHSIESHDQIKRENSHDQEKGREKVIDNNIIRKEERK